MKLNKKFRQVLAGIALIAATIIGVMILDGDATISLLGIPMGLICIFGKNVFQY